MTYIKNRISRITHWRLLDFAEALVQAEIVPDAVLPAGGRVAEVGKVLEYPGVDLLNGQGFHRTVLDGHEDEAGKGVRRLAVLVQVRIVGYVGRVLVAIRHWQVEIGAIVAVVVVVCLIIGLCDGGAVRRFGAFLSILRWGRDSVDHDVLVVQEVT